MSIAVSRDCALMAAGVAPVAERLVASAMLRAGDAVLDVATGPGDAALAAARGGCVVTAVDEVEVLLERGRQRAAAEPLNVEFIGGDAERLPCADDSFDAVLSCLGVMFTPNHRQAACELVRVCRPGGTIALSSWTPAGFVGRMFQTVVAHVPLPSLMWPPGLWGTEEHLERLFGAALDDLTVTKRELVLRFRSPADFVNVFRDSCGPVRKAFDALDEEGRERLDADLIALADQHDLGRGASLAVSSEYLEAIASVH